MSVSLGKVTLDKIAMFVMTGVVIAFMIGFAVALNT